MLRQAPCVRRPASCTRQQRARYATAPSQAKAVVYKSFGNPASVLKIENVPLPELGAQDVRVQMLAAPINPADLNMVQGTYGIKPELPAIGGLEGFGVVQETGASASLKRGDYVIAAKAGGFGTWRNYAVCSSEDLIKVPGDIEPEYGATLAVNPCTAVRLLEDFADLQPGDAIVQNGANSTVGHCVYQMAKERGIQTINIIRPRPGQEQLIEKMKSYGADVVITEDMLERPEVYQMLADLPKPKLALNCIGGPSATAIARLLGENGMMVTYGGMSRKPIQLPTSLLIFKNITLKGFWLTEWVKKHSAVERAQMINKVVKLVRDKKLRLWMERHALSDFPAALEAAQKPFRDRKIILMLDK